VRPVAIVQARTGSTRLPGKVLADVAGRPLLLRVVERARRSRTLDEVVVATTDAPADRAIVELCAGAGVPCFTGSEDDLLDRYRCTALAVAADPVVRITGDCPLLDAALVDRLLEVYTSGEFDYVAVAAGASAARLVSGRFPTGFDAECIAFPALDRAWRESTGPTDREHVTPYLWRTGRFRVERLRSDRDLAGYRCSVDTPEDLALVRAVYAELGEDFALEDVIALLEARPELVSLNAEHVGREGHERIWRAA